MPSGRTPKPTQLKRLQGNPGHRPLNEHEPKPTGIPTCPPHLDREAKREWKRISKELIALGLLTAVDRTMLALYASAYSTWIEAEENLAKFGKVIKASKSGYAMPNPYVAIRNQAFDQMRKCLTEFGCSPASRSRIQVEPLSPTEDAYDAFMGGRATSEDITKNTSQTTDDVCSQSPSVLSGCYSEQDSGIKVD